MAKPAAPTKSIRDRALEQGALARMRPTVPYDTRLGCPIGPGMPRSNPSAGPSGGVILSEITVATGHR